MATKAEIKLNPEGALSIMEAHDKEGIAYWFNAIGGGAKRSGVTLVMTVDGCETDTEIILWPGGQWEAKTTMRVSSD
jgi:hypothetical protein